MVSQDSPDSSRNCAAREWRREGLVFGCIVAIGVLLRLRAFFFDRALWLDELFLWSTLGEPRLGRAFEPLGEGQVVAPGFALLTQCVRSLFGDSEIALRALPFLAGVAAMPLVYSLFSRAISPFAGLLATAFVALSPHAIYYSAEFKPYSLDLCVASLFTLEIVRTLDGSRNFSAGRLLVGGLVAIFVSLPSPLVLAGCGCVLIGHSWLAHDRARSAVMIAIAGVWLVAFVAQYESLLAHHHDDPRLHEYWVKEGAFPAATPSGALLYVPTAILRSLSNPTGFGDEWGRVRWSTWFAAALFACGLLALKTSRGLKRSALLVLVAPLVTALLAGAALRYPFSGRVLFFAIPALASPVLLALDGLRQRGGWGRPIAWMCAALLAWQASVGAWRRVLVPLEKEESRAVVRELAPRLRAGDVVYLSYWGRFAWRYYAPRYELPTLVVVEAPWIPVDRVDEYRDDVAARLPRHDRVWLFITHFYPADDERRVVLDALATEGARVVETVEAPAAAAHRLDLGAYRN